MTSERTQAYGRVVRTLEDIGATKLHQLERERIREAADTLIFASTLQDARGALEDIDALFTDSAPPPPLRQRVEAADVALHVAEPAA